MPYSVFNVPSAGGGGNQIHPDVPTGETWNIVIRNEGPGIAWLSNTQSGSAPPGRNDHYAIDSTPDGYPLPAGGELRVGLPSGDHMYAGTSSPGVILHIWYWRVS